MNRTECARSSGTTTHCNDLQTKSLRDGMVYPGLNLNM